MSNDDKHTLLVVDDTPENIALLSGLLKQKYRVKVALSGEKALKVIAKAHPDLVLLDVIMPDMDGIEVCRLLKENAETAHIPIIFVTGEKNNHQLLKEAGGESVITKPVDPDVLNTMIEAVLG
jgi:CheY-like chemotaxis protein